MLRAVILSFVGISWAPALAFAGEDYCPKTISVRQQEAEQPPEGWRVIHDHVPHRLSAVTFYDGLPEQGAALVSDSTSGTKGGEVAVWRFRRNAEGGIWLSCSYAATNVMLARQLPSGVSSCTVVYDPKVSVAGLHEIRRIGCK